jgi:hypothetical protein
MVNSRHGVKLVLPFLPRSILRGETSDIYSYAGFHRPFWPQTAYVNITKVWYKLTEAFSDTREDESEC